MMSGKGEKAFCSGGDMKGLYYGYTGQMPKSYQPRYCGTLYNVDFALHEMKPIHICFWNGYVFGSGAGICTSAPIRIASENTEWAMPECVAGFLVDNATSIQFAKLKGGGEKYLCLGLYLAITGKRVVGLDVLRFGICTHFVRQEKIASLKLAIVSQVNYDTTLQDLEKIISCYSDILPESEEPQYFEMIQEIFKADSVQNIFKRVYSYPDQNHPFIRDAKSYLEKNSPMSMAICFELVLRGHFYNKE